MHPRGGVQPLGLEDTQGTVAVGKAADLVVLDADPLADIGHTRRIHAVLVRGRYLSRRDRARLLAGAAEAARGVTSEAPRGASADAKTAASPKAAASAKAPVRHPGCA